MWDFSSKIIMSLLFCIWKNMFYSFSVHETIRILEPAVLTEALSTLIRFQMKMELSCSVFKKICVRTYRFRILFPRPHYNAVSVLKTLLYPQCQAQINLTHVHFNISVWNTGAKLKPHGNVCSPFWILTVEWSHARLCLFWWRHHFQISNQRFQKALFSNRWTLESVFEWLRFQWSFSAL